MNKAKQTDSERESRQIVSRGEGNRGWVKWVKENIDNNIVIILHDDKWLLDLV